MRAWRGEGSPASDDVGSRSKRSSQSQLRMWKPPSLPAESEIQTTLTPGNQHIEFQTSSNLSLMDKLLLKKSRAGALPSYQLQSVPLPNPTSVDLDDEDSSLDAPEEPQSSLFAALESGALDQKVNFNFMNGPAHVPSPPLAEHEPAVQVVECTDSDTASTEETPCVVEEPTTVSIVQQQRPSTRPATALDVTVSEWTVEEAVEAPRLNAAEPLEESFDGNISTHKLA